MATKETQEAGMIGTILGTVIMLAGGVGLGFLFAKALVKEPVYPLSVSILLGVALVYLVLRWYVILNQAASFSADPLPLRQTYIPRESIASKIDRLAGNGTLVRRCRVLLSAWIQGGSAESVIALATFQSQQARGRLVAEAFFVLLLLVPCLWNSPDSMLAWLGCALLAVTYYVHHGVLTRMDRYLETRLLALLPDTAAVPAEEAQPRDVAAEAARFSEGLHGVNIKLDALISGLGDQIKSSLILGLQAMETSSSRSAEKMGAALSEHAQKVEASANALGTQLMRIAELEKSIEKILHVQEAVEATMKSVSASEETSKLFAALREHLVESDKLLREASRPRLIRLVETDQDTQAAP